VIPLSTAPTTAILRHWKAIGGTHSPVGAVRSREYAVPHGRAQKFAKGRIYWSKVSGAHAVAGPVLRHYDALGASRSRLGLPVRDEAGVPGGRVVRFQHGSVYWSSATGAHSVAGAIGARYELLGGPRGSGLGLPVAEEAAMTGGRVSVFQHGRITWTPTRGTKVVRDPAAPVAASGDAAYALHLLRRTTYGLTPALVAEVTGPGGAAAWLDRQLAPQTVDDSACDAAVARFPLAHATPPALYAALGNGNWDGMEDLVRATFTRACWSKRQLFEVMVEFWSNHLNITCPSSEVWATKPWDDEHVVRAHALGRFDDMLVASAMSPAMLLYLNGAESRGSAPNENYGREVLELHTVGVDAGYTQAEVVSCARALTGFTVWNPWNGGTAETNGTYTYRRSWHYVGPVSVLGWSHPNTDRTQGEAVAESLLRHLAAHPLTAARLARKLAVRFVSDDPPAALVERLAEVYLANGTAVVPVLRSLFASPEFAASTGQKYRRPYEDVVATVRALGLAPSKDTQTDFVSSMCWELETMGNAPLGWHPPNGYPDVAPAWTGSGTVLARWNLHVGLTQAWWDKGVVSPPDLRAALVPNAPATRYGLVDALWARLLPGTALPASTRDALIRFLGGPGPAEEDELTWLFPILTALVLDAPAWSTR
jgi:uncharacterized protein (DUF1800 family)